MILSGAGGDDIFSGYRRHYAANYQFLMDYFPSVLNKKIYSISSLLSTNISYTRRLRKYLSGFNLAKSIFKPLCFARAIKVSPAALYSPS